MPPNGTSWGQVVALDIDSDGNIYVLHRCGADTCADSEEPPLLKFDPSGRLLQTWGSGRLVWPHGLHIDHDGFIWVTDGRGIESKGHQVFKLNAAGEVLMTLGVAGVAGDDRDTLDGPTDVAVASNGDVFVADGHGNNRVVRYSPDGDFDLAWGRRGTAPGEFDVPHAIAVDSADRVYVADRDNGRIQIFDVEGAFIEVWEQFGTPSGFYMSRDDVLWVAHSLGVAAGSIHDGQIDIALHHEEDFAAGLGNVEDVVADSQGNVYAGLAGPLALHRLERR